MREKEERNSFFKFGAFLVDVFFFFFFFLILKGENGGF